MSTLPTPDLLQALSQVLTSLEDGAILYDAQGRFLFQNETAARLMGFSSPVEGVATPVEKARSTHQFLDEEGHPFPLERLPHLAALRGELPPAMPVVFRSLLTGDERHAVLAASPIFDAGGKLHQVLAVFRDVTAQRRSARSLRFIAEASAMLAASLDYATTLKALARLVIRELADMCTIELLEEDGSFFYEVAHVNPAREEVARAMLRHDGLAGRSAARLAAMQEGKPRFAPVITDDHVRAMAADEEHLRLLRALGHRSAVTVPLSSRGRILGSLILLRSESPRRFNEEDCSVAMELGSRAALAVDNARLFRDARAAFLRKDREARINEALQRVGTSFASELDPERLLQLIADEATGLTGAGFGAFVRPEHAPHLSSGTPEEAAARFPVAWATALFRPGSGLKGATRCDDATAAPGLPGPPPPPELLAEPLAARSLLAVPVVSRSGAVLGGLLFGHPRPGVFTAEHERAVASIAAQASVALDNARLFLEIRTAGAQLRDSEERLRLALAAGRMGYYDWDIPADKRIISPRLEELYGLKPGTFVFTLDGLRKVVHPEDGEWVTKRLLSIIGEGGESDVYEFRVVWSDGSVHWVENYSKVVRDPVGRPVRLLGVVLDITERHQAREKTKQLVEELVRSNSELEQFAYVASHDLQEPLRMVASYVQLLARRYKGKLDADADEYIRFAVDGATRMRALIDDLLAYSRAGSSARPLAKVSCQAILDRTLENLAAAIGESGAQVTADPLPEVMGDEVQLGQVFQNLIGNALKFRGEAPPHIHVGVERREREWVLSVRDNGIGIEPQYFQRIFVIFQRLHEKERYAGTGLGLAICKKIIERHGGRIWVESRPGQGATFSFTLPVQARSIASPSPEHPDGSAVD